jgi:Fic family protein
VLAVWLAGALRETQGALLHLDRLRAWQHRAKTTLSGWQGRTHLPLIHILMAWPMVSAAMAETLTGANRSTVQRNLTALQATGLLREVTGQGRYRLWTAQL